MALNLDKLKKLLEGSDIEVFDVIEHSKASESYIDTAFHDRINNFEWEGHVPYFYRRTGLFLETEAEIAEHLKKIKPFFSKNQMRKWIEAEKKHWESELSGRTVTKPFFDAMASLQWTKDFPPNNNPQRRIQDIKEMGYTISTKRVGKETFRLLLPLPKAAQTGYEFFSAAFKKRALKALKELNIYELSSANKAGLIPDHKFPEIRWNAETWEENRDTMPDAEIRNKFQLLDNQRNQQKREVCRQCFQTGKRGVLFGVKFFYEGDENWPSNVPKIGKEAERGCVGCGWYDIEAWREALNKLVYKSVKPNRPPKKRV